MKDNSEQNEKLNKIRYFFEHRLLPRWIEQDSDGRLLAALLQQQGQILYAVMKDLCKENSIAMPYTPQDYAVTLTKLTEEKSFMTITMPEPTRILACRRVYILLKDGFSERKYITIEMDNPFDYICGWDMSNNNATHLNYSPCPKDINEEVAKIIELF